MIVMTPQKIATMLHKSVRWVYDNAADLGGVKIAGSWIFTEGGVLDALQDRQKMAGRGKPKKLQRYKDISHQKRSTRLGTKNYKDPVEKLNRHGILESLQ